MHLLRLIIIRGHRVAGRIPNVLSGSILGTLLLIGAMWLTVAAQSPSLVIQQASLNLWPEYDDPGILVIFAGTFTDTVTFPQQVSFPLPEGARAIQATYQDTTGRLINQPWKNVDGKLTYTLPRASFHTEYYVDRPPSGDQREFTYVFQVPYPIQTLLVSVQQPAHSTDFSVVPQPDSSSVGKDGLTYYHIQRTDLASGDQVTLQIRYTKANQNLSIALLADASKPPAAQTGSPAALQQSSVWLPWLMISFGTAALMGLGLYWLWQRRRFATSTPITKHAQPKIKPPPSAQALLPEESEKVYCTQCGHRFGPEDHFCANCGAPR